MTKQEAKTISSAINTLLVAEMCIKAACAAEPFDQSKYDHWHKRKAEAEASLKAVGIKLT